MGRGKTGNRAPCSAKMVIIQTTSDEGLSEGKRGGMRAKWVRERFRKENQLGDWGWGSDQEGGMQNDPEVSSLGDGANDSVTDPGTEGKEEVGGEGR